MENILNTLDLPDSFFICADQGRFFEKQDHLGNSITEGRFLLCWSDNKELGEIQLSDSATVTLIESSLTHRVSIYYIEKKESVFPHAVLLDAYDNHGLPVLHHDSRSSNPPNRQSFLLRRAVCIAKRLHTGKNFTGFSATSLIPFPLPDEVVPRPEMTVSKPKVKGEFEA